ncbi:hypothetical protein TTHERM_01302820 (macronuclear) [Tetrahymena thermophila SB210]|uniref:Uncharacterized protein n=1 Tax=Tetrahymena thermophila (strain SB210) TaxID=312017 RepID=Q232B7_TETTS|nr:hypothetical protein TTHERM_01302820 [Tetrahymena thermophila SB210]EAR91375.2 hypothetical protein TTHERM_01302820 [Tetrahymena thermophila SB210]|eukprot:XP_001011620.2 hypothetical protein TTHERM_01302820 [Tetrahymena thermophila SB210]
MDSNSNTIIDAKIQYLLKVGTKKQEMQQNERYIIDLQKTEHQIQYKQQKEDFQDYQKNVNLQEGNDPILFCDNIVVFYLLPTMSLVNSKQDQNKTVQKNIQLREICKKYKLSNNLQMDVKHLRKPQQLNSKDSEEKKQIRKIIQNNPKIMEQYNQVIYNTRFENYQTDISYYDMKIEWFLKQLQQFQEQPTHTILTNQNVVGDNCLTYITNQYGFTTRHKLYNKFVCQLTSNSVQKKCFNNHLIDIFNSD